ncbi:penicillin-binding protein [Actibacterium mucosum KCTC 23349]|uniref:peptidoglycan glycosyltransferase n=1 Tax=Actibacterium mucosum KCTC 23349 TaxID=1454373 RepID=A0A037ZMW5_9RHOB|nr:penicillin-binding protein 1C [Actibacterium mucosum]KAJ57394.1 penicillin-binding protein [Actibacterium mucosum KCTC 23349]
MRLIWPLCLALILWAAALGRDMVDDWVDATVLPPLVAETSVEVLDRNGQLLRAFTVVDGRWRLNVSLDGVDPDYVRLLVAYEDKRFYRHAGVDPRAVLRAGWQALRNGRVVSGASTLTMQVARLLEDGPTGDPRGKLRQLRVALALERRLTKDQILTLYLNRAPFGANVEGVRAASLTWFGKPPRRLTPAEAAFLVALPQSPETRRPDRHPGNARDARARVLARAGQVYDTDTVAVADLEPVPRNRRPFPALAPHLARRATLEPNDVHFTTLDAGLQGRLQQLASEAVRGHASGLTAAIIVADHRSGEILASVGSAGFGDEKQRGFVDMTSALRSPGSTLKPLVYGLAFDQGLAHPETLINDNPVQFGTYAPVNFDGAFRGPVRVRQALQMSLNVPVVRLTDALGPSRLVGHMRRAGMQPAGMGADPGLAVALGGVGVRLTDLAALYAALGQQGRPVQLHWRRGGAPGAPGPRVLSPLAAWYLTDILKDTPAPGATKGGAVAFKTGTSYGHRDSWAVGYDGAHVVAVWMGRADGTPVPGVFGADLAAPLMFEVFARVAPRRTALPPPPENALLVANAQLPPPLRQFASRESAFSAPVDAPKLAFPPDGAVLEAGDALPIRLRDGVPPFTVLANGAPVVTKLTRRETLLPLSGAGFWDLSVVDAAGRSARAQVELR